MANYNDYSKFASDNTGRYPEGMQREDLNNQLRAMEARHRTFAEELPWFEFSNVAAYASATSFTVTGLDMTSLLTVGRTVRAIGSTTGTIEGEITVSAFGTDTTVTVVWNSGQLENETLTMYVNVGGGDSAETIVTQAVTATSAPSLTTHQITAQNDNVMFLVDATDGDVYLETPAGTSISNGFYFRFKRTDALTNTMRIVTPDGKTIDLGVNWPVSGQHESGTIVYDGSNWQIVTLGRNPIGVGEVTEANLADGIVSTPKLADDSVTLANLAGGTGGKIIGFDADGNPAEITNGAGDNAARVSHIDTHGMAGGAGSNAFCTSSDEIWAMGIGTDNGNGSHSGQTFNLPRKVSGFPTDKSIAKLFSAYRSHYVLTTDGKVYAWGRNSDGELGIGDTTSRDKCQQITALDGVVVTDIAVTKSDNGAEVTVLFLTSTGTVWSCGGNAFGQLGQGASPSDKTTATLISGLTGVAKVYISNDRNPHCLTVQTDGTIRTWGDNASGQLGLGDTTDRNTPATPGGVTDVASASITAATDGTVSGFSAILKTDGTLQMCGENKSGQLGQGNTTDLSVFTTVTFSPSATITKVSVGGGSSGTALAIDDTGDLWVWGDNGYGQCGTGNTTDQTSPQQPSGSFQGSVIDAKIVGAERYTGAVVRTASQAWSAGYGANYNVVRGDQSTTNTTFAEVLGIDGTIDDFGSFGETSNWGLNFLMSDGRLLTGGYGATGALGIGNTNASGDLQPVKGFSQKADKPFPNPKGAWVTATRYELGDHTTKAGPPISTYVCIQAHTSSAGTEPGVGASWATYWALVGQQSMHVGNDTVTNITTNFPAGSYTGYMAFITDETGGAVLAFSDGTDWRRCTDRVVIS